MELTTTPTLALIALFGALAAFCGWRGSIPPSFKNGRPRMIPWRPLMVVFAVVALAFLAHLGALLGFSQDRSY